MRWATVIGVLALLASCGDSGSSASSCSSRQVERIVAAPMEVKDLSVTLPPGTLDTDGDSRADEVEVAGGVVTIRRADDTLTLRTGSERGITIRGWADLNGDSRDDVLIDDGALRVIDGRTSDGTHDVEATGIRIDDQLNTIWAGDLDGIRGADFYVAHRLPSGSSTEVYSGAAILDHEPGADARDVPTTQTLRGLPRALARLEPGESLETVLFDPGPPSMISFAPRSRPSLRAKLGTSHRVEWVRVFDEDGVRKIALQVDRKVAVWPVPAYCD
jgi:hypothetical protein